MASITFEKVGKVYPGGTRAITDVSLDINDGEFLVLVGPSGCGKSTLLRMIAGLEEVTEGQLKIGERVVNDVTPKDRDIAMVFQNYALYPHMSVYDNMAFGLKLRKMAKDEIKRRVSEAARVLEITEYLERKPKALSGGQRQRVAIARALSVRPEVLIADEPVSALDVSIQAQILNLLDDLLQQLGLTMVFIAHQLSVVRHISDRVAIMYLGRIVEEGPTEQVFEAPQHPYTKALLAAAPSPDPRQRHTRAATRGDVPSPLQIPSGCRFRTRCAYAEERCAEEDPALRPVGLEQEAACHVLPFREST
jgi:oligopeptide/dipeptide ABC transporter ATP-binding protein